MFNLRFGYFVKERDEEAEEPSADETVFLDGVLGREVMMNFLNIKDKNPSSITI